MTQYKMNLIQFNLYLITHKIYENTKKGDQEIYSRKVNSWATLRIERLGILSLAP